VEALKMGSVELLVKLRDHHQALADAYNEELEKRAPPEVKSSWSPETIKWSQAQGTKGPYERYPAENEKAESTEDYRNILEDLKTHNGKMTKNGYFYWVFTDGATVGRKKRK
jgi:hypothetical protein